MNPSNEYVFGPVASRRLGRSLGVNPIPLKTCNYSCVYCQLGRTDRMTDERRDYFPLNEIVDAVRAALGGLREPVDYVTIAGEGEPTLCLSLGCLIREIKAVSTAPVAVITNGGTLWDPQVRDDLGHADLVMPSLDAADEETFRRLNRPHGRLSVGQMVDGLIAFRQGFAGKLWIEVMLVAGVNDSPEALTAIRSALDAIHPDRVCLNLPTRPPAESQVAPPDADAAAFARNVLGADVVDDVPEDEPRVLGSGEAGDILSVVRRHPLSESQIQRGIAGMSADSVRRLLAEMVAAGTIGKIEHAGVSFYVSPEGQYGPGASDVSENDA